MLVLEKLNCPTQYQLSKATGEDADHWPVKEDGPATKALAAQLKQDWRQRPNWRFGASATLDPDLYLSVLRQDLVELGLARWRANGLVKNYAQAAKNFGRGLPGWGRTCDLEKHQYSAALERLESEKTSDRELHTIVTRPLAWAAVAALAAGEQLTAGAWRRLAEETCRSWHWGKMAADGAATGLFQLCATNRLAGDFLATRLGRKGGLQWRGQPLCSSGWLREVEEATDWASTPFENTLDYLDTCFHIAFLANSLRLASGTSRSAADRWSVAPGPGRSGLVKRDLALWKKEDSFGQLQGRALKGAPAACLRTPEGRMDSVGSSGYVGPCQALFEVLYSLGQEGRTIARKSALQYVGTRAPDGNALALPGQPPRTPECEVEPKEGSSAGEEADHPRKTHLPHGKRHAETSADPAATPPGKPSASPSSRRHSPGEEAPPAKGAVRPVTPGGVNTLKEMTRSVEALLGHFGTEESASGWAVPRGSGSLRRSWTSEADTLEKAARGLNQLVSRLDKERDAAQIALAQTEARPAPVVEALRSLATSSSQRADLARVWLAAAHKTRRALAYACRLLRDYRHASRASGRVTALGARLEEILGACRQKGPESSGSAGHASGGPASKQLSERVEEQLGKCSELQSKLSAYLSQTLAQARDSLVRYCRGIQESLSLANQRAAALPAPPACRLLPLFGGAEMDDAVRPLFEAATTARKDAFLAHCRSEVAARSLTSQQSSGQSARSMVSGPPVDGHADEAVAKVLELQAQVRELRMLEDKIAFTLCAPVTHPGSSHLATRLLADGLHLVAQKEKLSRAIADSTSVLQRDQSALVADHDVVPTGGPSQEIEQLMDDCRTAATLEVEISLRSFDCNSKYDSAALLRAQASLAQDWLEQEGTDSPASLLLTAKPEFRVASDLPDFSALGDEAQKQNKRTVAAAKLRTCAFHRLECALGNETLTAMVERLTPIVQSKKPEAGSLGDAALPLPARGARDSLEKATSLLVRRNKVMEVLDSEYNSCMKTVRDQGVED